MAAHNDNISLSKLSVEIITHILRKLDGKCFIPMYQTCTMMPDLVEKCLKSMKYNDLVIERFPEVHFFGDSVNVMLLVVDENGKTQKQPMRLPVDTLDSFVWKFVHADIMNLVDDVTIGRYLAKVHGMKRKSILSWFPNSVHLDRIGTVFQRNLTQKRQLIFKRK